MSSLVIPSSFSTPNSTGKPCVSQPALRKTCFPFCVWNQKYLSSSCHHVVNSRHSVCRRRSFVKKTYSGFPRVFPRFFKSLLVFQNSEMLSATAFKLSCLYSLNFFIISRFLLLKIKSANIMNFREFLLSFV